jgi:formylglycine-generating enzyme required for sulfatase activity
MEWEKAARGSDGREFPWGNDFDGGRCNWRDSGIGMTSAVGLFPAQAGDLPYGLLDMSGNVWEWCYSAYDDKDSNMDDNNRRVLRGGSWGSNDADNVRAAVRIRFNPFDRYFNWGVRLARSV